MWLKDFSEFFVWDIFSHPFTFTFWADSLHADLVYIAYNIFFFLILLVLEKILLVPIFFYSKTYFKTYFLTISLNLNQRKVSF